MPSSRRLEALANFPPVGTVERLDPRLDLLIPEGAQLVQLADGFDWAEGPVWVWEHGYLLFSDIPKNVIYRWHETEGISVYLQPSGFLGEDPPMREPGSNGLILDRQGRLVACEHGERRVTRLEENGSRTVLASHYQGRRFNSPNDAVYKSNGDLYFTDPPYGLPEGNEDPTKELPFNGVFRVTTEGEVTLLTDELSRPNGIGFSPDEKTLYVANSDPERAIWMAYDVGEDGLIAGGRVFFDATEMTQTKKGLPDGLAIDRHGNLFATGPGGVLIFAPDGTHLGTLDTGQATANCSWGNDGTILYITADMLLCRIPLTTNGYVPFHQ